MPSAVAGRQFDVCGDGAGPIDERLAGVDGQELRREPVVGCDERREVRAHQLLREGQGLVGFLVGLADVAVARGDATVRDAVEVDVVIGGVRLRRSAASGVTRPRNWCWNSSVVGHADEQRDPACRCRRRT